MSKQQVSLEMLHNNFKLASENLDKYLSNLTGKHANSWSQEELAGFDLVNNALLQAHHDLTVYANQRRKF